MKILLVGEYSRLHNSLKEGLTKLGHEVDLVGDRDGFKNFEVDILIGSKIFNKKPIFYLTKVISRLTGINLISIENAIRFNQIIPELIGYDHIQLINEGLIKTYPKFEIFLLKKISENNLSAKIFLLSCGIDYINVNYAIEGRFKYSILTPLQKDPENKKHYRHILKKIGPAHYKLHQYLFKSINGVIATDLDYHIPLKNNNKYLGLLPNPINTDKIKYIRPAIDKKITIFHGVNKDNSIKKGNFYFDNALKVVEAKYKQNVSIIRTENIPYKDYISIYNDSHILLDMVYAYDQGYNALEAMAKGKVVFTGAEQEWLEYYNLKEDTVAINALPDVDYLVEKLSWLIENPYKILEISKNARAFIEREHNYIKIAGKYLEKWESA